MTHEGLIDVKRRLDKAVCYRQQPAIEGVSSLEDPFNFKIVVALMELLMDRKPRCQNRAMGMNRCLRDNLALGGIIQDLGSDYLCCAETDLLD